MVENGGANTSLSETSSRCHASEQCAVADDDDEPNIRGSFSFYATFATFMLLTLLEAANSTSTSAALVVLGEALHPSGQSSASNASLEWIGNAYMLASAVLQLPIAAVSGVLGRKPLVLFSFACFMGGSVVCGCAPNMPALLAGRTMQGIGGAGSLVLSELHVADSVPLRRRARYYAALNVMWAVGSGIGPLMGGGFTAHHLTHHKLWRWMFLLNVPISGVALVVAVFVFRGRKPQRSAKSLDYVGTLLVMAAATSFVLGLTLGGSQFPWSSWHVVVPLVLGSVGMAGFGVWERHFAAEPMLHVEVLYTNLGASTAFAQALIQGFMMEALPYYLPLFFQGVLMYSPLLSGVALLPFAIIVLPSSAAAGYVITKWGKYKWVATAGWALLTLGLGLLLLPSPTNRSVGTWLGPLFPTAMGLGVVYATLGTAVQAAQKPPHWTDAAAMMSAVRSLGEAMGVAVGGAIFASQMAAGSRPLHLPANVDPSASFELVHFMAGLSTSDPLQRELQDVLTKGMHTVYYLYLGLSGLAMLLSLVSPEYSLEEEGRPHERARTFSSSSQSSQSSQSSCDSVHSAKYVEKV